MALEPSPGRSLFCQRPLIDTPRITVRILPLACSIAGNRIEAEGASALAAVLKETQITTLKCATPPQSVRFRVNAR